MHRLLSWPLLAVLVVAVVLAVAAAPVGAAPAQQAVVTIVVFSYVDVTGPACNLVFDAEDQAYATSNPLPEHEFVLRDGSGNEISRQMTSALAEVQRARFEDIAELETYQLELTADPSGWALCPNQERVRTLTAADFSIGRARVSYFFYQPGQQTPPATTEPTAVPTEGTPGTVAPTATVGPGTPTLPPPPPTTKPSDGGDGGRAPAPVAWVEPGTLGSIKGLAFIDLDADGKLGPSEPGLNDVQVYCHGGSVQLSQITPSNGQFSFEALGIGEYDVFVQPGPEWRITTPSTYKVKLAGNVVQGIDFGLIRHGQAPAVTAAGADAGRAIRLPSTGFMAMPRPRMLGGLALLLAVFGLVGLTVERWKARRL